MKKIVYITNVRLPTHKAHGLQIMKSCEAFAENGVEVILIVPNLKTTVGDDPFRYYGVKNNFSIKKTFVLEVLPLKKWVGSWVVYVQSLSFSAFAVLYAVAKYRSFTFYSRDLVTLYLLALFGLNFAAEIHDYRMLRPNKKLRFIIKKAHKVILNSNGTFKLLLEHYSDIKEKGVVIPNGVDLRFFDIKESKEEARGILGLPLSSRIIGYIGSLETVGIDKGIGDLISAFEEASEDINNTELYIIGGPDHLINKYKTLSNSNVIKFTGHVPYQKIPLYLRALDAVVIPLPNNRHGQTTSPIKLFEFMAAGKIIISSDIPAVKNVINESGIFFEADNTLDLSAKLKDFLEDKIPVNYGKELLEKSKEFSWTLRAKKIINLVA